MNLARADRMHSQKRSRRANAGLHEVTKSWNTNATTVVAATAFAKKERASQRKRDIFYDRCVCGLHREVGREDHSSFVKLGGLHDGETHPVGAQAIMLTSVFDGTHKSRKGRDCLAANRRELDRQLRSRAGGEWCWECRRDHERTDRILNLPMEHRIGLKSLPIPAFLIVNAAATVFPSCLPRVLWLLTLGCPVAKRGHPAKSRAKPRDEPSGALKLNDDTAVFNDERAWRNGL